MSDTTLFFLVWMSCLAAGLALVAWVEEITRPETRKEFERWLRK